MKKLYIYLFILLFSQIFLHCDSNKIKPDNEGNNPNYEIRNGDYYVSVNGDDSNSGTKDAPFKTIQRGVKALSAGQTLIVKAGIYDEFVNIEKGGTSENLKINILSERINDAQCDGFRIFKEADNIKVNGFKIIENQAISNGIIIYGCENIEISDCFISECSNGGIRFIQNAINPIVINNTMEHNGFFGIYMDATNALIKNNTISKTVQFHPNCNPSQHQGADADGIIIYGSGHQIIGNTIIDIGDPTDSGNVNPHCDCIQTSKSSTNTVLQNSIIANNYFRVNHNSGKGIIMESYDTDCHDILIYNNIFEVKDIGVAAYNGQYHNIKICNNIFKTNLNQQSWGTAVFLKNIENYMFSNNITIDCKNEHRKIIGGTGIVSSNLAYNSDNSSFSMTPPKQSDEITGQSPEFIKYTSKHGENDYHLKENSPAKDNGKTINFVNIDKDNIIRPQENAYDIGVYEYKQ